MSPRFTLAGTTYTVRESPDFTVMVNQIITKRFGPAAARDRQDIHETDLPVRSWAGIVNGTTYTITELTDQPSPRPTMRARSLRVSDVTWQAAQDAADERGEVLSEEIRKFLVRYGNKKPAQK